MDLQHVILWTELNMKLVVDAMMVIAVVIVVVVMVLVVVMVVVVVVVNTLNARKMPMVACSDSHSAATSVAAASLSAVPSHGGRPAEPGLGRRTGRGRGRLSR